MEEIKIRNIILVPLLAYDKNKNRLGYGKGFYDKYLNQYFKMHKKILFQFKFLNHMNSSLS